MFLEIGHIVVVGRDRLGELPEDSAEQPDFARDLVDAGAQFRIDRVDLLEHPVIEQDQPVRHEIEIRGRFFGSPLRRIGLQPCGRHAHERGAVKNEDGGPGARPQGSPGNASNSRESPPDDRSLPRAAAQCAAFFLFRHRMPPPLWL
jgi:hypothetical protein